ncbi:hypothetical protein [Cellulomonas hominis]
MADDDPNPALLGAGNIERDRARDEGASACRRRPDCPAREHRRPRRRSRLRGPLREEAAHIRPEHDDLEVGDGRDGWHAGERLGAVGVARRAWQDADDRHRGAVQCASAAGDPWWLISLMLQVDEPEGVRRFGDEPF